MTTSTDRGASRNVLVAFDGTDLSERALRYACTTFSGDAITALYVIDPSRDETAARGWGNTPDQFEEWIESMHGHAERNVFARANEIAEEYDQSIATEVAVGSVHGSITDYWDAHDVDFVVLGARRRGSRRLLEYLWGDVGARLARTASIPTVLVREDAALPEETIPGTRRRRLLVPFDQSDRSERALEFACSTFPEDDLTALCMSVVWGSDRATIVDRIDPGEETAERLAANARRIAEGFGTPLDTVFGFGALDRTVVRYVEENPVDLVVAGTAGKTPATEYFSPGAPERLVSNCPVPLLAVPASAVDP
jgi:nucleotide-binding universal stress UspA family protein